MTMAAISTSGALSAMKSAALDFFGRRSTKTHIIAFCLGMVTVLVCLRCGARDPHPEAQTVPEAVPAAETINENIDTDAECAARVLYGIRGYGLTDKAKAAVIEVIQNRAEDNAREFRAYNTIADVCNQANQWQGYDPDGEYLQEDYELAKAVLHRSDGGRMIPRDCYFLLVENGQVTARTEYDGGNAWKVR